VRICLDPELFRAPVAHALLTTFFGYALEGRIQIGSDWATGQPDCQLGWRCSDRRGSSGYKVSCAKQHGECRPGGQRDYPVVNATSDPTRS